jgi:dsRNA-specific ribonuclease
MKNKFIKKEELQQIFKTYKLVTNINNISNYYKAFTHSSFVFKNNIAKNTNNNEIQFQEKSNERLEFLGDLVIKLCLGNYLFTRYPLQNEGFLSELKNQIENKTSLAKLAMTLGLNDYILICNTTEINNGRMSEDIRRLF